MYNSALKLFVTGAVVFSGVDAYGAWFMPLPQLPGASEPGDAYAVSADALFAVGASHDGRSNDGSTNQAVRWTTTGVVESLNAGDSSFARGVSGDGGVV